MIKLFNSIISNKTLANVGFYTILSFIQKGVSFLVIPIYTLLLKPEELGLVNQLIAIGSLYILFLGFGLDEAAGKFYFSNRKNLKYFNDIIGSLLIFNIGILIIFALLLFFLRHYLYNYFIDELSIDMTILSIVLIITTPTFSIYQKILRMQEKAVLFSFFVAGSVIAQVILGLFLLNYLDDSAFGLMLSYVIVSIIMFFVSLINLMSRELRFKIDYVKMCLKYALPIVPHRVFGWATAGFTIVFLGKYSSSFEVGIFIAVGYLGVIIDVLSKALFNALQPWIYTKMETIDVSIGRLIGVFKSLGILALIFSFILASFSEEILMLLIDSKYHSGIIYAPLLVLSSLFLFFGSLIVFVLYFDSKTTKYISYSTIAGAVSNILLGFLFIPSFGIIAAIICLIISNIIITLSKQYYVSKVLKQNIFFFDQTIISLLLFFIIYIEYYFDFIFIIRFLITLALTVFTVKFYFANLKYSYNILFKNQIKLK